MDRAVWQAAFQPQAWINGHAIDVDPDGETHWDIAEYEAHKALPEAMAAGADLDYLREHPNAPQWVRSWSGPFRIEIIAPDRGVVDHASHYPRGNS